MDERRLFLDRLHELCEWEGELSYHDGFRAGYEAANAEMVAALRFALGGPGVQRWRDAAWAHHRAVGRRRMRESADRAGPRSGDHPGGPVDFDPAQPTAPGRRKGNA